MNIGNVIRKKVADPVYLTLAAIALVSLFYFSGATDKFIVWWKLRQTSIHTLLLDPIPVASQALISFAKNNPPLSGKTAEVKVESVSTFVVSDTHFRIELAFQNPELKGCFISLEGALESAEGGLKGDEFSTSAHCLFYDRVTNFGSLRNDSFVPKEQEEHDRQARFLIDSSQDAIQKMFAWTALSTSEKIKWGRE